MNKDKLELIPIAKIETPFTQKFGIPRQANLATGVKGKVIMEAEFASPDYLRGLEQFSHLWLSFGFHQHYSTKAKPLVRPPRLGGNGKIGVFASRSSFRPNPLGLSLVKFVNAYKKENQSVIEVEGVDLLNDTPIYDIKPYIPYSDIAESAVAGYAQSAPSNVLEIVFTSLAQQQLQRWSSIYEDLPSLINTVVSADPRPAYKSKSSDTKGYAIALYNLDVTFRVLQQKAVIEQIVQIE